MADTRQRTTWGSRFRFVVRTLGLSGVAAVVVGGGLALAAFPRIDLTSWAAVQTVPEVTRAAAEGAHGELAKVAAWLLAGGLAAVAVALVVEVIGGLLLGVGRRTAAGTSATAGVVAAVALLLLVNAYSFTHYGRYDATRDQRFTLPPQLATELGKLRASAPTTIVVHQTHSFGSLAPRRDSYTKAAEEKVTEKVKDLVDQFREFGPRFNVVVLDTEAFGYERALADLTADAPELKAAIAAAPENSIFFHANKRVQRLSFNEFMQLDKAASKEGDGAENLVLLPQGIDTFARRVLAVQERRPKVALCVVHEALGTTRGDGWRARYSMSGLRKALTDAGFEVTDIVLKKNWGAQGGPKPAADTPQESALERLESELRSADAALRSARAERNKRVKDSEAIAKVKGKPWAERAVAYSDYVRGGAPTEDLEPEILEIVEKLTKRANERFAEAERNAAELDKQLAETLKDERQLQYRRLTDVSAKLTKQFADVDLLIVPRFTTEDALEGQEIDPEVHALSAEQVKVAKEFMKSGKPVLACLGPNPPQFTPERGETLQDFEGRVKKELADVLKAKPEEFEQLLADRGIELGRTVVLFDGETKSLTSDRFGSGPVEVPPLAFATSPADAKRKPNPISAAARLTGRTAESTLELRFRALRPVALSPAAQARQPFAAEVVETAPNSWNELRPFPTIVPGRRILVYAPEFEAAATGDPTKGTRDEEKRGPFTVAVAVESKIPAAWVYDDYEAQQVAAALDPFGATPALGLLQAAEQADRPTQRTVVFGSGHVFGGPELKPAQEKLLLHTVNWLTAREDRLPQAELPAWRYPRVAMSDRDQTLWRLGTAAGLPLVVAYTGLLAMMRRKMR